MNLYLLKTFQLKSMLCLKQAHFKFRVMAVRDKAMNVFDEKYILISGFVALLEVEVLGKVLI